MDKVESIMSNSAALNGNSRDNRRAHWHAIFFSASGPFFSAWPYRLLRMVLGGVFLWSGISKLIDPLSFSLLIEAYGIIPENWVMPVAYGLPVLEVLAGLGLLLDVQGSLSTITALLLLFMAILGYGIFLGLDIDCGCFGPEDPEGQAYHGLRGAIYRDVAMLAAVIYVYVWRWRHSHQPLWIGSFFNSIMIKRRLK
jgi:uncharacterized membrane protein YphA (DoxX/SURF4 family)